MLTKFPVQASTFEMGTSYMKAINDISEERKPLGIYA